MSISVKKGEATSSTLFEENQKLRETVYNLKKELDKYTSNDDILHQGYVAEIEHLEDLSLKEFIKNKSKIKLWSKN